MLAMFGKRKPKAQPPQALPKRLHQLHGLTMGTTWTAQFAASDTQSAGLALQLQAAVDQVDGQMSTWKPDSALSQFNAMLPGDWFNVPAALAIVVQHALAVGKATSGAFDITVGKAVAAWGFGPKGLVPDAEVGEPSKGLAALDVRLDPPALKKTADLHIDLSGIAKGYGVDQLAEVLERAGIADYLVTLDGELRCNGRKPGVDGTWTIGLDAPVPDTHRIWDILTPATGALATSGDYRHFRIVQGKVLAHTIDPSTGRPLDNTIASVTVHAPHCWQADAWATALMVLGPQHGVGLAQARNIAALFLVRGPDGLAEIATGAFDELCGRVAPN
jgi:thiamine biosynthesis lipoprotein